MKHQGRLILIFLVLLVIGCGFYWFQIKPAQIRKECKEQATIFEGVAFDAVKYETCLKRGG